MAIASFVHTGRRQDPAPASGFRTNDNTALDQVSLFVAGGLGPHLGAFAQVTYDGVAHAFAWDNLDVRATTTARILRTPAVLGLSLNNSPGVQDPWNTLPAWGFPFTDSALAPSPAAQPLISGAFAQTTLGLTAYAWIADSVYVEGGAYGSPGATTLRRLGADPDSPGDIEGLAPYGRIAIQRPLAGGTAEAGAFALGAAIHPGRARLAGLTDDYLDLGVDASWQRAFPGGDVVAIDGRFVHERLVPAASCALDAGPAAGSACGADELQELRATLSYAWKDRIAFTASGFDIFGSPDARLYPDAPRFSPDSSGVTLQIDATPFGGAAQPVRRLNVRVGLQFTLYAAFDGADTGAAAHDTLRVFTWFAF